MANAIAGHSEQSSLRPLHRAIPSLGESTKKGRGRLGKPTAALGERA